MTRLGLPPEEGGFAERPGARRRPEPGCSRASCSNGLEIYVGVLAATILFIATNAGVIGASRITYAMAGYRQLPSVFRRLHQRFKTPWLALDRLRRADPDPRRSSPGETELPGDDVLVRRDALVHDRRTLALDRRSATGTATRRLLFRAKPNLRWRGVDWPIFAVLGGIGTLIAWVVIVLAGRRRRAGPASAGSWLGFVAYAVYRRCFVHELADARRCARR